MAESPPAAPGRIFISYRREETAYPAGWLFDRLADHLGRGQVFKDVDSIQLGDDFVEVITRAVGSCDVLLALIGDEWLTITDQHGRRRLDNPADFVRLEIEAALARHVRVIPILVDGARMPRTDELPPSLAALVRRQALELSPTRFDFDTSRLLRVLDETLAEVQAQPAAVTAPAPPRLELSAATSAGAAANADIEADKAPQGAPSGGCAQPARGDVRRVPGTRPARHAGHTSETRAPRDLDAGPSPRGATGRQATPPEVAGQTAPHRQCGSGRRHHGDRGLDHPRSDPQPERRHHPRGSVPGQYRGRRGGRLGRQQAARQRVAHRSRHQEGHHHQGRTDAFGCRGRRGGRVGSPTPATTPSRASIQPPGRSPPSRLDLAHRASRPPPHRRPASGGSAWSAPPARRAATAPGLGRPGPRFRHAVPEPGAGPAPGAGRGRSARTRRRRDDTDVAAQRPGQL